VIVVIMVLVAALAFLLGQRSSQSDAPEAAVDMSTISSEDVVDADGSGAEDTAAAQQTGVLPVRIGRDGPNESACERVGRVANLPGGEDDVLAVREAPTTDARQIDTLGDDAPLYVCDRQGQWYGIVYLPDGTLGEPGQCGLENPVGSPRAYAGACLTGWVSSRYVDASGAQDSAVPYVDDQTDAGRSRTVEVSASGPSQALAVTRMVARAESEFDKPVAQRPDGNRVNCRETGTGDEAWTCTATYTLAN